MSPAMIYKLNKGTSLPIGLTKSLRVDTGMHVMDRKMLMLKEISNKFSSPGLVHSTITSFTLLCTDLHGENILVHVFLEYRDFVG